MITEDDLIQVECQKINPFLNFMVLIRLHFSKQTFLTYVNIIWMVFQRNTNIDSQFSLDYKQK